MCFQRRLFWNKEEKSTVLGKMNHAEGVQVNGPHMAIFRHPADKEICGGKPGPLKK
jgi:hypothetical protein